MKELKTAGWEEGEGRRRGKEEGKIKKGERMKEAGRRKESRTSEGINKNKV